ncbi:beta-propeller fold lactonase family protein [Embleya sp. NPDC059259]|uniref:beta-propeller fold lactonase family protein n=1 Tax=unclassified Embleya TaxID=2699296 RepID=UPI0036A56066
MDTPYHALVANQAAATVSLVDIGHDPPRTLGEPVHVGAVPCAVALGQAGAGYVVSRGDPTGSGTVAVIDLATPQQIRLVDTVSVGARPRALALNHSRSHLYVVNWGDATVSVFAVKGDGGLVPAKPSALPTGALPRAIVADGADHVYVADWAADSVTMIGPTPDAPPVTFPVGRRPRALATHPTRPVLYVANWGDASINVVHTDRPSGQTPCRVAVGAYPRALAVDPDGAFLYVANYGSGTVTLIGLNPDGTPTGAPRTVDVGRNPAAVVVAPDGKAAYVADHSAGALGIVNPELAKAVPLPLGTTSKGSGPIALFMSAEGARLWITDHVAGGLVCVSRRAATFGATAPLGNAPLSIAVGPGSQELSVTCPDVPSVSRIPVTGFKPESVSLNGNARPWGVAYAADGKAYVTVTVANGVDGLVPVNQGHAGDAIPLTKAAEPRGVAITPDGLRACTANSGTDSATFVPLGGKPQRLKDKQYAFAEPVALALFETATRSELYVSNNDTDTVSILGLDSKGAVTGHSSIAKETGKFAKPHGIAIDAQGTRLYVANYFGGNVSVLSYAQEQWTREALISGFQKPHGIALAHEDKRLYVADATGNAVYMVDLSNPHNPVKVDTKEALAAPKGVAVRGNLLYVAHEGGPGSTVAVFALNGNGHDVDKGPWSITLDAHTAGRLTGVSVSADGRTMYATHWEHNTVYVAGLQANGHEATTIDTITEVDGQPLDEPRESLASRNGGALYIVTLKDNTVSVLPRRIDVSLGSGTSPWGIACDDTYTYVTGHGNHTVSVLETATGTLLAPPLDLGAATAPTGIAHLPGTLATYVVNQGTNTIRVLTRTGVTPHSTDTPRLLRLKRCSAPLPGDSALYAVHDGLLGIVEAVDSAQSADSNAPILDCGPGSSLRDVATHPARTHLYTTDSGLRVLRVVDIADPRRLVETRTLPCGGRPAGLSVDPQQPLLYVCETTNATSGVVAYNVEHPDEPRRLPDLVADHLPETTTLALHPTYPYAYLAHGPTNARITVYTRDDRTPRWTALPGRDIAVPAPLRGLAVHPSGGHAYAISDTEGSVTLLDLADPARPRRVGSAGAFPGASAIVFPDRGDTAHLVQGRTVTSVRPGPPVVDGESIALDAKSAPWGVAAASDGSRVHVTGQGDDKLHMIDTRTRTVVAAVPLATGAAPTGVVASLATATTVYVAVAKPPSVVTVDIADHPSVQGHVDTGTDPRHTHARLG